VHYLIKSVTIALTQSTIYLFPVSWMDLKKHLLNKKVQYVDIFKEFQLILLACSNFNKVEANISMDGMLSHSNESLNFS
jgi:hypothetical protein